MSGIIRIDLPLACRSLGRRPSPNPATRPVRFFTNHESRNMVFTAVQVAVSAQGSHHQKPPSRTTEPVASSLFPCSRLFTIVRHCSAKNIAPEPVSPLRPHRQHGLLCSSRNTVFPCSSGDSKESNPKPDQRVFHESRDTNHETRLLCFSRVTKHGIFVAPSRLPYPPFPGISRHFPGGGGGLSKGSSAASDVSQKSVQFSVAIDSGETCRLSAAPVALRAASAAANAQ